MLLLRTRRSRLSASRSTTSLPARRQNLCRKCERQIAVLKPRRMWNPRDNDLTKRFGPHLWSPVTIFTSLTRVRCTRVAATN